MRNDVWPILVERTNNEDIVRPMTFNPATGETGPAINPRHYRLLEYGVGEEDPEEEPTPYAGHSRDRIGTDNDI